MHTLNSTNSYALCIGIGKREDDKEIMSITANDASQMAIEIGNYCNFPSENIYLIKDKEAKKERILNQLDYLIEQTKTDEADTVIIFFSGHGKLLKEEIETYFLITQDTELSNIVDTAISGEEFATRINDIKAQKMLILLDCCHAGGILKSVEIPFNKNQTLESKDNRVIIAASHQEEQAINGRPFSPFTYALIEGLAGSGLQGNESNVTIFNLAMYTRERVLVLSRRKHRPQVHAFNNGKTSGFVIAEKLTDKDIELPDFELYKGNKSIPLPEGIEKDEAYRKQFNWLKINIQQSGGNNISQIGNNTTAISSSVVIMDSDKAKEFLESINQTSPEIELSEETLIEHYLESQLEIFSEEHQIKVSCGEPKKIEYLYVNPLFETDEVYETEEADLIQYINNWISNRKEDVDRNIVVLGGAGSGKSTFLRNYFCEYTNALVKEELNENKIVPFYFHISNLSSDVVVDEFIKESFIEIFCENSVSEKRSRQLVNRLIKEGRLLFIIDAFDEVKIEDKARRMIFINKLFKLLSGNRPNKILLAGRPSFFRNANELNDTLRISDISGAGGPYFQKIVLQSLTKDPMIKLLKKYLSDDDTLIYYDKIISNEKLHDICKRPMYLHVLGDLIKCSEEDKRKEKFVDEIFSNQNITVFKLLKLFVKGRFTHESKKQNEIFLERKKYLEIYHKIAEYIYGKGELMGDDLKTVKNRINLYTISNTKVEEIISDYLPNLKNEKKRNSIKDYFLTPIGNGHCKFTHQIFMDYFLGDSLISKLYPTDGVKINYSSQSPLIKEYYWSDDLLDMVEKDLNIRKSRADNIPKLLVLIKGERKARRIATWFKIKERFYTYAIILATWVVKNSIILFLTSLFIGLFIAQRTNDLINNWFIVLSLIPLLWASIILLIRMNIYSKGFERITRNGHRNYDFNSKIYRVGFQLGELDPIENQQLLINFLRKKFYFLNTIKNLTIKGLYYFKHNVFQTKFLNINLKNGGFMAGNFYDCEFIDVNFKGTEFYMACFENCKFHKTDFSQLKYNKWSFYQMKIIRKFMGLIPLVYNKKEPQIRKKMFLMNFLKMDNQDMDEYTIKSLKKLITKHSLIIGEHIVMSDELLERLEKT